MNLEQQVVSLDLAKRLKELDVKQESYFYWTICHECTKEYGKEECSLQEGKSHGDNYSAFTVAELGEILPENYLICIRDDEGWYGVPISHNDKWTKMFPCKTEADARAKMLVYLIENKLISI